MRPIHDNLDVWHHILLSPFAEWEYQLIRDMVKLLDKRAMENKFSITKKEMTLLIVEAEKMQRPPPASVHSSLLRIKLDARFNNLCGSCISELTNVLSIRSKLDQLSKSFYPQHGYYPRHFFRDNGKFVPVTPPDEYPENFGE